MTDEENAIIYIVQKYNIPKVFPHNESSEYQEIIHLHYEDQYQCYLAVLKAKEIIREYMRFEPMIGTCSFYSEEYEKTKKKAEQFLNSEVEK